MLHIVSKFYHDNLVVCAPSWKSIMLAMPAASELLMGRALCLWAERRPHLPLRGNGQYLMVASYNVNCTGTAGKRKAHSSEFMGRQEPHI